MGRKIDADTLFDYVQTQYTKSIDEGDLARKAENLAELYACNSVAMALNDVMIKITEMKIEVVRNDIARMKRMKKILES